MGQLQWNYPLRNSNLGLHNIYIQQINIFNFKKLVQIFLNVLKDLKSVTKYTFGSEFYTRNKQL